MKLEQEIARVLLNSLPRSILVRVLKRSDVAALVEAGSAEVKEIGQFFFAEVREALARAKFGVDTPIRAADEAGSISITRASEGLCKLRGQAGNESVLPALALLDPAASVRLSGARLLDQEAMPSWPRSARWQAVLGNSPLDDSEFSLVLDELNGVAEPVLAGVISAFSSGQLQVEDIFPVGRTYYESLLGEMPVTGPATRYVADGLLPHLQRVFGKDVSWGLRCLRASYVSDLIDPVEAAIAVGDDDLLAVIDAQGPGCTPFAILATYRLAAARATRAPRFVAIAEDALSRLLAGASNAEGGHEATTLYLAIVRLTLSVIGQAEELATTTPFWRRLAAFAHASLIVESVEFSEANLGALLQWCDSRRHKSTWAAELVDHLAEPLWRADVQRGADIWFAALVRAIRSGAEESVPITPDQQSQLELLQPNLVLWDGTPDPICGARRDRAAPGGRTRDEDLLTGIDSDEDGGTPPSLLTWQALAHSSRIYVFNDALMLRIRALAQAINLDETDGFTLLGWCSEVASTQGDLELAEIVIQCVLKAAGRFEAPADANRAAAVVVMASAAAPRAEEAIQYASDPLLALAHRLPRSPGCGQFARTVETIQRFVPLEKRKWGKAIATARSAAP